MNKRSNASSILFFVALVFASLTSCAKSSIEEFQPAYWPTQEWINSLPEEQGMDPAQLVRMFEYIEENDIPLHGLLIVRNGYLVTEAYWHPYGPNDKHSIESITKSMIGTLIGIAIDHGAIRDVDQQLLDFFPQQTIQNLDSKKKSITLRDLLSMTPGLDCEDAKSLDRVTRSDDWVQSLLDLPMASRPGSKWIYCSGQPTSLRGAWNSKCIRKGLECRSTGDHKRHLRLIPDAARARKIWLSLLELRSMGWTAGGPRRLG
jgi:CubicO group peptidase (beta-lactamase class C family)